ALSKGIDNICEAGSRGASEKSDHWHRGLLRARRERPSGYTAADQCDEVPPPHGAYPQGQGSRTNYSTVHRSKKRSLLSALGQSRQIDIPQPAGNVRFAPKAAVRSPTGAGRVERRESWPGKDVEGEIEPRPGIGERSGLSKPHVRFSREQTLVAPAKLV